MSVLHTYSYMQRKILRKIYGTITHQNDRGIRNDDELHVMSL